MKSSQDPFANVALLSGDEKDALLREARFVDVELFYAALSFRGWVSTAQST